MEQEKSYNLVDGTVSTQKVIMKLAWPVIAEQSLTTLTSIVDMMMVGRLGSAAITAIGLSIQPLLLAQALGASVSVGTTALVARFTGAGEKNEGNRVLQQSLLMASVFSFLILSVYFLLSRNIIIFMGAETDVIPLGTEYLRIIIPGLLMLFISFTITAALRGAGDTVTPMRVNIFVNIINVIGNYILIFGKFGAPELGLAGAAVATSFARSLGCILLFVHIIGKKAIVSLVLKDFRVDIPLIRRVIKIGIPATLEQLVMRVAQILFARLVAGLGTLAYAAHQIAINAESISYMPGFGIAVAATTLVGQNLGANAPSRAEESAYAAWKIGVLIMGLMGIIFFVFPHYLIRLYTTDPEIVRLGVINLRIIAIAQIPMGTQFIFAGALRGAGDTRPVFISTAFSSWAGRLGLAYLLVNIYNLGLAGAWASMVVDWCLRGCFVYWWFRKGTWKTIKV